MLLEQVSYEKLLAFLTDSFFKTSYRSLSMAVFILETDYPSGRTWASLFSASDNSSKYKYGHEDELSIQTNYLRCVSVKTYNLRFFVWTHFQYLS